MKSVVCGSIACKEFIDYLLVGFGHGSFSFKLCKMGHLKVDIERYMDEHFITDWPVLCTVLFVIALGNMALDNMCWH